MRARHSCHVCSTQPYHTIYELTPRVNWSLIPSMDVPVTSHVSAHTPTAHELDIGTTREHTHIMHKHLPCVTKHSHYLGAHTHSTCEHTLVHTRKAVVLCAASAATPLLLLRLLNKVSKHVFCFWFFNLSPRQHELQSRQIISPQTV